MASIDDAASADAGTSRRRSRLRGGLVTVGTVTALVAALGLTLLGRGAAEDALASFDAEQLVVEQRPGRAGPGQRDHRPGGHPQGGRRGPAASGAGHPDRPVADPARPGDRSGQRARPGHPPDHRDHPHHAGPRGQRGRCTTTPRSSSTRCRAWYASSTPVRWSPVGDPVRFPPGITGRRVRRSRAGCGSRCRGGHRLGDHRRRAAVRRRCRRRRTAGLPQRVADPPVAEPPATS